MEFEKAYNLSQKASDRSVQLCAKLVGDKLERPVTAVMYPVSIGMHGFKFKAEGGCGCGGVGVGGGGVAAIKMSVLNHARSGKLIRFNYHKH